MTPEQIEELRIKADSGYAPDDDEWNTLCDLALKGLQVEEYKRQVAAWNAKYLVEAQKAEAMREAIRRAVDDLDTWLFVTSNKNDRITATVRRVRADLEQALNERKET